MSLLSRAHFTCVRCRTPYLHVSVVDGEGGTEETLNDGHDRLRYVLLQGQICMVPVRGSVAYLKDEEKDVLTSHYISVHMRLNRCVTYTGHVH